MSIPERHPHEKIQSISDMSFRQAQSLEIISSLEAQFQVSKEQTEPFPIDPTLADIPKLVSGLILGKLISKGMEAQKSAVLNRAGVNGQELVERVLRLDVKGNPDTMENNDFDDIIINASIYLFTIMDERQNRVMPVNIRYGAITTDAGSVEPGSHQRILFDYKPSGDLADSETGLVTHVKSVDSYLVSLPFTQPEDVEQLVQDSMGQLPVVTEQT